MSIIKRKNNDEGFFFPSVFSDLLNVDRFFETDTFKGLSAKIPAVNISENGNRFNVELAAPGLKKDDFKINVENDVLTISSEKEEEKKDEDERYTRREYSYNAFSRSFVLPEAVKADEIDAKYENGILKLVLPKKEESRKKAKKEIRVS